jgi:hypothetical protein
VFEPSKNARSRKATSAMPPPAVQEIVPHKSLLRSKGVSRGLLAARHKSIAGAL